jgi:hypothetical protein
VIYLVKRLPIPCFKVFYESQFGSRFAVDAIQRYDVLCAAFLAGYFRFLYFVDWIAVPRAL